MKRYTQHDMHSALLEQCGADEPGEWVATQALHCPYYVPLQSRLGSDWGVILNPVSTRFGMVTFEHDDCGCPGGEDRHRGEPDQDGDMWWSDWQPDDWRQLRRDFAERELEDLRRDTALAATFSDGNDVEGSRPWIVYVPTATLAGRRDDVDLYCLGAFTSRGDAIAATELWVDDRRERLGEDVEVLLDHLGVFRTLDSWIAEQS